MSFWSVPLTELWMLGSKGTATKSLSKKEANLRPLRKVTSVSDWLDEAIAKHSPRFAAVWPPASKGAVFHQLAFDRRMPSQAEITESVTDRFHLQYILEPAALIVAAMRSEKNLTAGYAAIQSSTQGDLMVFTPVNPKDEKRTAWVTIEDKRIAVYAEHRDEFAGCAAEPVFLWPATTEAKKKARPGRRMWIQVLVSHTTYAAY
ncbi:hypothetical protein B0H10DRAFT_241445 [Mycena sp. CBHHK59/15]|nr:hypothetical protein B0H10DRAFT_241445 [Mycena sp. CBHHK59/15]